jgi:hypothetical protein
LAALYVTVENVTPLANILLDPQQPGSRRESVIKLPALQPHIARYLKMIEKQ